MYKGEDSYIKREEVCKVVDMHIKILDEVGKVKDMYIKTRMICVKWKTGISNDRMK